MTKIIFIRHGETLWNTEGRLQGHLNSPLTKQGELQAALLGQRLSKQAFTNLYSSDLGRALQTAEYISQACDKKIKIDKALREHNMGIFQGLTKTEIARKYPRQWAEYNSTNYDYPIPEGESQKQRATRIIQAMNNIANKHNNETTVIVSHGEVLGDIFEYILDLAPNKKIAFSRKNTSYNVFTKVDSIWSIDIWGDTSHLDEDEAFSST